jgi:hypothetical protein
MKFFLTIFASSRSVPLTALTDLGGPDPDPDPEHSEK